MSKSENRSLKNLSHKFFELSSESILIFDSNGNLIFVNFAMALLLGYQRTELTKMRISELFTDALLIQGYPEGEYFQARLNRFAGDKILVKAIRYSEVDEGVTTTLLRIQSEAEVQAESLKSAFLASMSHELRTPLNSIVGLSDLLLESGLNDEQLEYATVIRKSSNTLTHLVNEILDFSKIEAKKLEIERICFRLQDAIDEIEGEFLWSASAKGLVLTIECPTDVPAVIGDPNRIRQVIRNLISNAIKFTEVGFVALRVSLESTGAKSLKAKFEIEDTGIGLNEAALKKIFEPFVQSDSSTTRQYGGTGLGLSISKSLVELMSGTMGVRSEVGDGSVFWFELPFEVGSDIFLPGNLSKPEIDVEFKSKPHILIVEDIASNKMVLKAMLSKLGIESDAAESGSQAIEALKQRRYDMVLMDCHMPGMDGFKTTQQIRLDQDDIVRNVPIVALTASAMAGDRQKCISVGMNDYLTKPVTRQMLVRCLSKWFSSRRLDKKPEIKNDPPSIDSELVALFKLNVPMRISALKAAIDAQSSLEMMKEAHGLKSATCYFNVPEIGDFCEQICVKAKNGEFEEIPVLLTEIQVACRRAMSSMGTAE